ncbi:hypothetical protein BD408DRAFT_414261 [Parasitella parasitica]|nr:hypothetical protein BD408DRAFT_414261 [Parasitella parasitica]
MLATVKFMVILLFFVLATSNIVSAEVLCEPNGVDGEVYNFCCLCPNRLVFTGNCLSGQKTTCDRVNMSTSSANNCGKGRWACQTDYGKSATGRS